MPTKELLAGPGDPPGIIYPWIWGNSPTRSRVRGYPWSQIVMAGMGLGSPYLMVIYPLPFLVPHEEAGAAVATESSTATWTTV